MAVFRINKTRDYTVMSNHHLKDRELSLKAKGLLSLMLSLPDDWDYSISGLCSICIESESAIKSALNELKKRGYLNVTKLMPNQTTTGRIEYEYNIFEQPQINQTTEKQGVENLCIENQAVENPPQLNTKESITKKQITKVLSKDDKSIYYAEIVDYLNSAIGTQYRAETAATKKHIAARLNEGFTVDDFKTVIDKKVAEWLGTDMEKYLRPETLFGTKFESYLNAKVKLKQPTIQKQPGSNIFLELAMEEGAF